MSTEISRGRFVWHELMTSDPTAAESFYTQLTDWSTQVWDGGPTPYTMWMNGETAVGGLMQLPDEAKQQGPPRTGSPTSQLQTSMPRLRPRQVTGGGCSMVRSISKRWDGWRCSPTRRALCLPPTQRRGPRLGTMGHGASGRSPGTSSPQPTRMRRSVSTTTSSDG